MSQHENIVNCFHGTQQCENGLWGPCGGSTGTLTTKKTLGAQPVSHDGKPSATLQSLSQPSGSTSACANDPCNPWCVGFDEQPTTPLTPTYTIGAELEGNPDSWGNAPSGFKKKQDCSDGGDCRSGYPKKCNGDPTNYNQFDGCLADHHCNQDTGKCDRNDPGWSWPTSVCAGIDLTAGPACNNGENDGFPLCNRGNTAVPTGTTIKSVIAAGNWLELDSCPINPSGTECSITLAAPLAPGHCVRIIDGVHCSWNGNAVVYVNSDKGVGECGMPQATPPIGATSPGCSNNWSDVRKGAICTTYSTSAYSTQTLEHTYTASCPTSAWPVWDRLAFDGSAPCSGGTCTGSNGSSIELEVQTAPSSSPSAFVPSTPVLAANAPTSHPAFCSSSGPSPCPVDLYEALGKVAAHNSVLKLTITLNPSPDGHVAPTLNAWQITYSCPEAE